MDCLAQSVDRPLSTVCARQSMDCTSSRREKSEAQARGLGRGAAEILSRLCLFVNSENSQLAKWCGLYSLSLSAMEVRLHSLTVGWQLTKDVFSDLINWKTSYCSELSDWPFELSRVLTITLGWVASLAHITNSYM